MSLVDKPIVIVGSYAAADAPGLHAFRLDTATGELSALASFSGVAKPSFFVVHPSRRWLYTVSETGQASDGAPGAVQAFQLELDPVALRPLNRQPSGGDWPCHLQLDATGQWIFVSNYGTGSAAVFPIRVDGRLGPATARVQHQGGGPNRERQEGPHAHSVILSPDNQFAIVADLGIDALVIYRFHSEVGTLTPHGRLDARPGAGPRHMAFHPDGRRLFVANELDNTLSVCDYDPAEGLLRERQTLDLLPAGAPENTAADIHLTPSGERVYVSNRGHNSLAVFDVAADGPVARVAVAACGGNWPRNFALAPGGRFILVANQYSGEVAVLPVLPGTPVGEPVARAAVPEASCVQFV